MFNLKTYKKNDTLIKATPKAYELFYKNAGFKPVDEKETVANIEGSSKEADNTTESGSVEDGVEENVEKSFKKMSVTELKAHLDAQGISYSKKATKAELLKALGAEE